MSGRLIGKRALIMGAAPGNIGAAIAARFIAEGARVVVAGRRADAVAGLAAEIGAVGLTCDITIPASVDRMVADAATILGGLDIAVNATGWGLLKPFLQNSVDDLELMSAIQFVGPFRFFQAVIGAMPAEGSIIQISSVTATIMMEDHAAYMGTKAAIDHVIRCIANEFGGRGIRANSIAPGGTADAPMSGGGLAMPAMRKLYEREIPLKRPGVSQDVANTAVWLASDESSFVTGQVIHVSGGQTLRRNPSIGEIYAAAGAGS